MRLSNTTACAGAWSHTERIKMLAEAGYDCVDLSMSSMINDSDPLNSDEYVTVVRAMAEQAEKSGVTFNQGHAIFNVGGMPEEDIIALTKERTIRAMDISAMLGIGCLVVHPLQFRRYFGNEEFFAELNRRFYRDLIPFAEDRGVVLACENMWQSNAHSGVILDSVCADPYEFNEYIDSVASPFLTACLDLGHCGLCGREAQDCLRIMGKRVTALHVHDNDYVHDSHTLPGFGKMDWDAITEALADIGYEGDFTFESDAFFKPFNKDKDYESEMDALRLSVSIGRKLIGKIERAR